MLVEPLWVWNDLNFYVFKIDALMRFRFYWCSHIFFYLVERGSGLHSRRKELRLDSNWLTWMFSGKKLHKCLWKGFVQDWLWIVQNILNACKVFWRWCGWKINKGLLNFLGGKRRSVFHEWMKRKRFAWWWCFIIRTHKAHIWHLMMKKCTTPCMFCLCPLQFQFMTLSHNKHDRNRLLLPSHPVGSLLSHS